MSLTREEGKKQFFRCSAFNFVEFRRDFFSLYFCSHVVPVSAIKQYTNNGVFMVAISPFHNFGEHCAHWLSRETAIQQKLRLIRCLTTLKKMSLYVCMFIVLSSFIVGFPSFSRSVVVGEIF